MPLVVALRKKWSYLGVSSLLVLTLFITPIGIVSTGIVYGAECDGVDIDGQLLDATVYSYSTGRFYDVQVEFDGEDATIYFSNGRSRTVTLDDEEIDDPSSISAYDYETGTFWEIDIGDCEGTTGGAPYQAPPARTIYVTRTVTVNVNGARVGNGILVSNGRVYIPIRLVTEHLGGKVQWDAAKRQVVINIGARVVVLPVGMNYAVINGSTRVLDSPAALLYQQRAHVAVRYVSELLGATVRWDARTATVYISQ